MGSSDEPGARMAIGTSREGGKAACAIVHSASDGLITCGQGGNQGLKAQRWNGMHKTLQTTHLCRATPGASGFRRSTIGASCERSLWRRSPAYGGGPRWRCRRPGAGPATSGSTSGVAMRARGELDA